MTHDTTFGLLNPLAARPGRTLTFVETVFVSVSTVAGILAATFAATLVAPVAPSLALATFFVALPAGIVATGVVLRTGRRTVTRSGIPATVREMRRRVRTPERVAADGGTPEETACNC
ncbi:hypothetical protein [Haloferax sp. DFSO52]|uniref:hypothetical protein n=1 Tax=Haloferax sp. DFSO52 TaxID=3388505 RepID=UPI003A83DA84